MHRKKSYAIPKRALLFWGLVGVIAAFAAGISAFAAPGAVATTTPAPSTATAASHLGARPKETPANNPNFPFATDAMLPPTLAAGLHGEATEVARGYLRLTQEPGLAARMVVVPTQGPTPAPHVVDGTGNNETLSPYLRMMDITNHWIGVGKDPVVIAGALLTDPRQGVTVLAYGQRNSSLGDTKVFPTPTKHGAVRITAVNGSVFTLTAADGTVFTFDIKAMTYR